MTNQELFIPGSLLTHVAGGYEGGALTKAIVLSYDGPDSYGVPTVTVAVFDVMGTPVHRVEKRNADRLADELLDIDERPHGYGLTHPAPNNRGTGTQFGHIPHA